MRRLLIIVLSAFLGLAASAQQGYQTFTADTVKGAVSKYFTSSVKCPYSGYATFDFKLKGFGTGDSCTVVLQGNNQDTVWNSISAQKFASTPATNRYQLYDNPAKYSYYRLRVYGKASDTVRIFYPLFIYKR